MPRNWKNIKDCFYPDGSLRDIYVLETSINDWETLIDFLNKNYKLTYTDGDSEEASIDKVYAIKQLKGKSPNNISKKAWIHLDNQLKLSLHFFIAEEIEIVADPKEINSMDEFNKIEDFMIKISKLLNSEVIMTGEDESESPFLRINFHKNLNQFYSERKK